MAIVLTLGELLIDFVSTQTGVSLIEAPAFQKAPGGAPANVAVGLARLGVASGFLGKVGDDDFGHFLALTLEQNGVETTGLRFSHEARTMLAFVSVEADGERDFMFYRHPSADMLLRPDEIDPDYVRAAQILHCGSISLIDEPSRSATLHALETARNAGRLISYDPNLRLNLWPDAAAAREGIMLVWPLAQVVKVSGDELVFLSGMEDAAAAVETLWHPGLRLVVVTDGREGSRYYLPGASGRVAGFAVETVDTTGAGDGFVAGLLKGLVERPDAFEDEAVLRQVCRYANAVGALTTTQRGAIPALPRAHDVETFLQQRAAAQAQ